MKKGGATRVMELNLNLNLNLRELYLVVTEDVSAPLRSGRESCNLENPVSDKKRGLWVEQS